MSRRAYLALLVWLGLPFSASVPAQTVECPCAKQAASKPEKPEQPEKIAKPVVRHCGCPIPETRKCPSCKTPEAGINVNVALDGSSVTGNNGQGAHPANLECAAALTEGEAAEKVWDIELASSKYDEAMRKCDVEKDRARATEEYSRLTRLKASWWYTAGTYFPPVRWAYIHPFRCLLVVILLVIAFSPKILPKGGVVYWSRRALQAIFMPTFLGQAVIITPTDLGMKSQAALFAAALQYNSRLARRLVSGDRNHLQVRSTNLLSIPSEFAASTFKDIPEIKGVNVGSVLQLLLNLGRYFGWRVETQLAFFPATKKTDGAAGRPARMLAVATLRWAWFADAPVRVICEVKDAQDVDDLAFAVAARILGRYFVS